MQRVRFVFGINVLGLLFWCGSVEASSSPSALQFLSRNPGLQVSERGGMIRRIAGQPFSSGATPAESAGAFLTRDARVLGVAAESLVPAARPVQPLMYQPAGGTYRFTAFSYTQQLDGIPVFGATLRLVVRNEPAFALVLASSNLRGVDGFTPDPAVVARPPRTTDAVAHARAVSIADGPVRVLSSRRVIWAGADPDAPVAPRLADETLVGVGEDKWLVVTDSVSGAILYDRHRVHFVDLTGTVDGMATLGLGAEQCGPEVPAGLPYLHVTVGAEQVTTDADGFFSVARAGTEPIGVSALLSGEWFVVQNAAGSNGVVTAVVTPPGPAELHFNEQNASEFRRAEVNAYLHANRIRDYILQFNPDYPTLGEGGFPVRVNRSDLFCPGNAWYDAIDGSLNFCRSGAGSPNTAFASVIFHEFGHHLVEAAGSGQEEYGEGMGDAVALLVLDVPELGLGFFGDCSEPLRTADNDCQHSETTCSVNCGSEIHACGRVLSGAIWSLRNELASTNPEDYREILSSLTINSILLHTGDAINADIVTDFLTLDDDDATLCNGTPHSAQISAGFAAHGLVDQSFAISPAGEAPEFVSPDGGTPVQLAVCGPIAPIPGGVKLFVLAPELGGYLVNELVPIEPGLYEGTFPARPCGSPLAYFFTAEWPSGQIANFPADAPAGSLLAFAGASLDLQLDDDFEQDRGWTISSDAGLTSGEWERDVPIPLSSCNLGNPGTDADGSGRAFLTDNRQTPCPADVDGGSTVLTSPPINLAGDGEPVLVYSRWYSTHSGPNPYQDVFVVQVSANDGASWMPLESVGVFGLQASGGWFRRSYALGGIVGNAEQFRVRFIASDSGGDSTVEAAVDGVKVGLVQCTAAPVLGDLDGNGVVDGADLGILLADWGASVRSVADLNGDGVVDGADLGILLGEWTR